MENKIKNTEELNKSKKIFEEHYEPKIKEKELTSYDYFLHILNLYKLKIIP